MCHIPQVSFASISPESTLHSRTLPSRDHLVTTPSHKMYPSARASYAYIHVYTCISLGAQVCLSAQVCTSNQHHSCCTLCNMLIPCLHHIRTPLPSHPSQVPPSHPIPAQSQVPPSHSIPGATLTPIPGGTLCMLLTPIPMTRYL